MHLNILKPEQVELLPLITSFASDFYLAGGTAMALQIGHRSSIDFDLFSEKSFNSLKVKQKIQSSGLTIQRVIYEDSDQLDLIVNSVKLTFLYYPCKLKLKDSLGSIMIPDLLTLSATKALALAGLGKWKDYVDLAFIFKRYYSLKEVSYKAKQLFGELYNEKLFREQLCCFDDIDYSETIDFVTEPLSDEYIKSFLTEISLSF